MQIFQPNCSLPDKHGFVRPPNSRGTLEIVWSCFAVILLCSWSILIVNVPEEFNHHTDIGYLKSIIQRFGRSCYLGTIKLGWMMFTVILPEFVLGKALSHFMRAREIQGRKTSVLSTKHATLLLPPEKLQAWTYSHTMFADIGGFVVDFRTLLQNDARTSVSTGSITGVCHGRHGSLGEAKCGESTENLGFQSLPPVSLEHAVQLNEGVTPGHSSGSEEINNVSNTSTNENLVADSIGDSHLPLLSNYCSLANVGANLGKSSQTERAESFTGIINGDFRPSRNVRKPSENLPDLAMSEDTLLTNFIDTLTRDHGIVGQYNWQPHPEHRRIINLLASEGHITTWSNGKFDEWSKRPFYTLCGDKWVLNAKQIMIAAERRLIALPKVSWQEIHDKSKSNGLIIILALIQILNLVASLLSRTIQGKAISQLEVMALAYAVCSIFTYVLQWSCAKDVEVPITIDALRPASKEDVLAISEAGRARWWWGGMLRTYTIPYLFSPHDSASHDVGVLMGLIVFGLLHLVAWSYTFPTVLEQLLWRIASLSIAIIPLLILVIMLFLMLAVSTKKRSDFWQATLQTASLWPMAGATALFVFARLILLVEVFRSLYFLPQDGYFATWANGMPRIG